MKRFIPKAFQGPIFEGGNTNKFLEKIEQYFAKK